MYALLMYLICLMTRLITGASSLAIGVVRTLLVSYFLHVPYKFDTNTAPEKEVYDFIVGRYRHQILNLVVLIIFNELTACAERNNTYE